MQKPFKLDLKKFKAVHSDDKHTVLRHKDGHEFKVAHGKLTSAMKAQLDELRSARQLDKTPKMNKGGEVKKIPGGPGSPYMDKKAAEEVSKGAKQSGWTPEDWGRRLAEALSNKKSVKAGKPQKMNQGGEAENSNSRVDEDKWNAFRKGFNNSLYEGGEVSPDPVMLNQGGEAEYEYDQYGVIKGRKKSGAQKFVESLSTRTIDRKTQREQDEEAAKGKYKGGQVKGYYEGDLIEEPKEQQTQQPSAQAPVVINIGQPGQVSPQQLPGVQPDPRAIPEQQMPLQAAQMPLEQPQPVSTTPAAPMSSEQPIEPPSVPQGQPSMAPQQAPDPFGLKTKQGIMESAVSMGEKGLRGQTTAEVELAKAQEDIAAKKLAAEKALQEKHSAEFQAIKAEYDSVLEDYKAGRLNPNQYMEEMDTGSKILTAISVALGGMAQGFGVSENPGLAFLNRQIDRNIEAQKANLGKKQSLLSAYMQKFNNLEDATKMTRLINEGYYASLMEQQIAKIKQPLVKAQGMQKMAEYKMGLAEQMSALARKQALMQGAKEGIVGPEMVINEIVPEKDKEAARKELSVVQGAQEAMRDVTRLFKEIEGIGPIMGNLPFTSSRTKMETTRAQIYSSIRSNMKGQGALSDQEMEDSVKPLLPQAGHTVAQLNEKRAALLDFLSSKLAGATPTLGAYPTLIEMVKNPPKKQFTHLPYVK